MSFIAFCSMHYFIRKFTKWHSEKSRQYIKWNSTNITNGETFSKNAKDRSGQPIKVLIAIVYRKL